MNLVVEVCLKIGNRIYKACLHSGQVLLPVTTL